MRWIGWLGLVSTAGCGAPPGWRTAQRVEVELVGGCESSQPSDLDGFSATVGRSGLVLAVDGMPIGCGHGLRGLARARGTDLEVLVTEIDGDPAPSCICYQGFEVGIDDPGDVSFVTMTLQNEAIGTIGILEGEVPQLR